MAENLLRRRDLPSVFKRLDFLHSGMWLALDTFPEFPGVPIEDGAHRWVLFLSNFSN